jgi:outer membrane receptor protein involved in Fe transport
LCGCLLLAMSAAAAAATRSFDIPGGPAARGITQFAQQAGLTVLFPYELLEGRRTRPLHGELEVEAGLRALLRGTGLEGRIDERGQISIRAAASAAPGRAGAAVDERSPAPRAHAVTDELPEAAVTGTRLAPDGMTTPTPVAMVTSEELALLDPANLINALAQLPHFLNNDTPQTQSFGSSGAAGASHLNLRGIGSIRTLTLLDGRRVVPSSRFGTVDIALLPRNLLRRVEVVTGGASAAYGSDAVSGVVNLILNDGMRGFNGHAQAGLSELGEYGNLEAGATFGTDVGERSSLLLSAELFRADGIRGYAGRGWFDSSAAILNPVAGGPREIIARDVHATGYTDGGLILSGPLAGTQFLAGGVPAPFATGSLRTSTTQSGGSGLDPAAEQVWILPDQRRLNGFARFTTMPDEDTTAWLQMLAGRSENRFGKDLPSLWGSWAATIYRDNAFLPDSLRSRMAAANVESFRLGRIGADGDLGNGMVNLTGDLTSATAGVERRFGEWSASGYYQFGRDLSRLRYDEAMRVDRVYRALDSVFGPDGRIVCRSTLSYPDDGCVPLNVFGPGSVSPEARAWITEGYSVATQDVREQTAEASLKGELPGLPAGPISVAAGATWRHESIAARTRRYPRELDDLRVEPAATQGYKGLPAAYSGTDNIFERTAMLNVAGSYSVLEAFGEARVPLLRGLPLVQRLDLHAALRESRYSGSGAVPAWKLGLDWQPGPALRLRATRSRDVRAGSLSERYDSAGGGGGTTIVDLARPETPVYAVVAVREGNPQVRPEKSDTTTAGLVLQPGWAPGLSLSADYYDIRIRDVISTWGAQSIINGCFAGVASACQLIDRGETGLITRVHNRVLNLEQARARGIDLELSWRGAVNWFGGDSLAVRLFANRALESSTTSAGGLHIDRAGQTGLFGGAPRLQANLSVAWARGPLQLSLAERYISSGSYFAGWDATDISRPRVRSAAYTALQAGWEPLPGSGVRLYFNIQNLFDQDPRLAPDWGFGGSMPTNEGLFDVLGRRYVAGVRYSR